MKATCAVFAAGRSPLIPYKEENFNSERGKEREESDPDSFRGGAFPV